MKKIILGMVLGLSAVAAHANDEDPGTRWTTRYECSFTEPFVEVTYDTYSKSINVKNEDGKSIKYVSGVTMKGDEASDDVNIVDKDGKAVLTLRNEEGTNGMNDELKFMLTGVYNGSVGGCNAFAKKIAD